MAVSILHETENYKWIDVLDLKPEEIPEISAKYHINHLLLEAVSYTHLDVYKRQVSTFTS